MQSEQQIQTLFQISNAVITTSDLDQLYQKIHQALGSVIDVTNFYIALWEEKEEIIYFPYFVDHKSKFASKGGRYTLKSRPGSLTAEVIRSEKPLFLTKKEIIAFCEERDALPSGPVSEIWVGVPLILTEKTVGVVAVQSYTDPNCYSEEDVRLLMSVSDQIAMAIDRKQSQIRYENLIEHIADVVYTTDSVGRMRYTSASAEQVMGYSAAELSGCFRWESSNSTPDEVNFFIHPDDRSNVSKIITQAFEKEESYEIEYRIQDKTGGVLWVFDSGKAFRNEMNIVYLEGIIRNNQKRKRAELLSSAIFNISNAVSSTEDLDELFSVIHDSLKPVLEVQNFGVGLYDEKRDNLEFSYYSSAGAWLPETKNIPNASQTTSLTMEVVKRKSPTVFSKQDQFQFAAGKGGDVIGTPSEFWLGVPLIVRDKVIGAMITETLNESKPYSEEDVECFASAAEQVAIALERKEIKERIQVREKVIDSLYRISNQMHASLGLEDFYKSIHSILAETVDMQNFTVALYDENKDVLNFPFSTDIFDKDIFQPIDRASESKSLVYRMIAEQKSFLITADNMQDYEQAHPLKMSGDFSAKCWLGVPLQSKNKAFGAIINQSYDDPYCYDEKDVSLLESISDQIALAIEYKNAKSGLVSAQNELLEKAHKAGMADIASDTIHNIGDILQAVKSSNESVKEILNRSNIGTYSQIIFNLKQKLDRRFGDDFDESEIEDLMRDILVLEPVISQDYQEMQLLTDRLVEKIGLMTAVIRRQQNYLNDEFIEEECHIEDVINRLLKMHLEILKSYGITVEKKFEEVPKILVQKTKLEHIIMNILNNAKESLECEIKGDKKLVVSLFQNSEHIFLSFKDNGVGIAQEDLSRIFSHGFTTKNWRQGFGLHNAANFMNEMGGSIRASSEGLGKGAVFSLQFPKKNHLVD